jgi:hypothetical protein
MARQLQSSGSERGSVDMVILTSRSGIRVCIAVETGG